MPTDEQAGNGSGNDREAGNVRYFNHPAHIFDGDAEALVAFLGLEAGDMLVSTGETGVWFDSNLVGSRPMMVRTGDGFVRVRATLTHQHDTEVH